VEGGKTAFHYPNSSLFHAFSWWKLEFVSQGFHADESPGHLAIKV
jgi:hypothetical protein